MRRLVVSILLPTAAVVLALLTAYGFLWALSYPAAEIFRTVWRDGVLDLYGFSQVLRFGSLLTFAGLAVGLGFRAGLFNIGVEGQVVIGGLTVAVAGYLVAEHLGAEYMGQVPWPLLAGGALVLAMAGGALWGLIPGVLKAVSGAHEVITTIMLNFIALALVNYLLGPGSQFAAPGRMQTPRLPKDVRWPRASELIPTIEGSTLNAVSLLAPIACLLVWVVLRFTRAGFKLRAAGSNPDAAEAAGISNRAVAVWTMTCGGALAGLIGLEHVVGEKGYMEEGFSGGVGFMGIAVALLGKSHPAGIMCAGLLFGLLQYGRIVAGGMVPGNIFLVLQAVVIFLVLAVERVGRRRV